MSNRFLSLRMSPLEFRILLGSMRVYAETAFPKGCVDCQLAAREALLGAASELEAAWRRDPGGVLRLNRRLRPLCRYAVERFPAEGPEQTRARASLLAMLTLARHRTGDSNSAR
jgi:hypothetical protein